MADREPNAYSSEEIRDMQEQSPLAWVSSTPFDDDDIDGAGLQENMPYAKIKRIDAVRPLCLWKLICKLLFFVSLIKFAIILLFFFVVCYCNFH